MCEDNDIEVPQYVVFFPLRNYKLFGRFEKKYLKIVFNRYIYKLWIMYTSVISVFSKINERIFSIDDYYRPMLDTHLYVYPHPVLVTASCS